MLAAVLLVLVLAACGTGAGAGAGGNEPVAGTVGTGRVPPR